MEEQNEQEAETREMKPDMLVDNLVVDPTRLPHVRVFVGFLGRSPEAGYWRLYLTPTLDRCLEISEEHIMHHQSLASEQNSLGGTILWVKQDAPVVLRTRTDLRQAQAQFLQGEITTDAQGMLAGRGAGFDTLSPAGVNILTWFSPPTPCWPCIHPKPIPPPGTHINCDVEG